MIYLTQYRSEQQMWNGPEIEAQNWDEAQTIAEYLNMIEKGIDSEAPTIAAAFMLAASHCSQENLNAIRMELSSDDDREPIES